MTDWCGYLALAEELAAGSEESRLRSAISRAYYSAFHTVLDKVVQLDDTYDRSDRREPHRRLWDWWQARPSKVSKRIAMLGRSFRDKRNNADYDDVMRGLESEAKLALKNARTLVTLIDDKNI